MSTVNINKSSANKVYLTRLIIETTSPMAINTGNRETLFDSQLARDVNNLPYIPATGIAGEWQSIARQTLLTDNLTKDTAESDLAQWFGFTNKNSQDSSKNQNKTTSQASSLTISDGVLHNSNNEPVQGLLTHEKINQDKVLSVLIQTRPHLRERVSINDRGVAKDTGKFDQILLPAGVRFCIDIKFFNDKLQNNLSENEIATQWQKLLSCWQHPQFAFGSSTRNGLGKIKIIASEQQVIELSNNSNASEASKALTAFAKRKNIPNKLDLPPSEQIKLFANLPLKALDNWRCGSGTQLLDKENKAKPEKSVSMISYSEAKFNWSNNKATFGEPIAMLCGSSIKGILAHRLAYHLRRHQGVWAEDMSEATHEQWQTRPEALQDLLGISHEEHDKSLAGKLFVEDSPITYQHTTIRHHNSIDRFTGGVRKGALFTEELLYQPEFTLKLSLQAGTQLTPELNAALIDTLNDLKNGLLPMGAGSGRGTSLVMVNNSKQWLIDFDQVQIKQIKAEANIEENIEANVKGNTEGANE
ncbi:MAG: hypothetical protein JJW02_09105 [Pseudoalteromonas sp.]|nr:hypothetical protein [Pseudoalteromonas sp.]